MKKVFLDVFDGTKTSTKYYTEEECAAHCVQGESVMFYMLMNGYKLLLTQTQIMDSGIIHTILNMEDSREPFLQFIRDGKIEVVLQKAMGAHSLVGYMRQSLRHGIEDDRNLFEFSIFPFMSELEATQRRALHKKALEAIEQHHYDFSVQGLDKKYTDLVRKAVINLQDIDRAIEGRYIQAGDFVQHIHEVVAEQAPMDASSGTEASVLWNELVERTKIEKWDRRSDYYGYLEQAAGSYSNDAIGIVRLHVNNCYNIAVSSSLKDVKVSLNFAKKNKGLIQPIRKAKNVTGQLMALRPVEDAPNPKKPKKDPLTWSRLAAAIEEVDKIQRKRPTISRSDAIRLSKNMQLIKPVTMTARYVGLGVASNLVPVPGIAEGLELLWGAAEETADNVMKKPTLMDTLKSPLDSLKQNELLKGTSAFYTLLVNDDE